jgi:uncharacterized protein with HEPN domain
MSGTWRERRAEARTERRVERELPRRLQDLSDTLGEAQSLVARSTEDEFSGDARSLFAAEALIGRVGEIVANLPASFTDQHPGVEWQRIRAMRNLIVHRYWAVDDHALWLALTIHVPALASDLAQVLPAPRPRVQPRLSPVHEQIRAKSSAPTGLCGQTTKTGTPCRNRKGACPHHR